jgi:hypothetical protein
MAVPIPWSARNTTSPAAEGAKAAAKVKAVKTTMPTRKNRSRPYRSATRPAGMSNAAATSM